MNMEIIDLLIRIAGLCIEIYILVLSVKFLKKGMVFLSIKKRIETIDNGWHVNQKMIQKRTVRPFFFARGREEQ